MANQKLAAMTVAGTVNTTDLFYIEQGSLPKKITFSGLFGTIRFANNLLSVRTPGTAQSEKAVLSLYGTFVGSADNGTRRVADISAGFSTATWGTQYLAFHVGIGSSANDVAGLNTEWMRIDALGRVGIGTQASLGVGVHIGKALTGSTTAQGVRVSSTVNNDVTGVAYGYKTSIGTTAAAFTLSSLIHLQADQGAIGAGSTVTTQVGFDAGPTMTGAVTNIGFRSELGAGANRWNFYAAGTAQNYFAGNVGIGIDVPTGKLDVNDNKVRVRTAQTPASATATGNQGEIAWDSGFVYVCVATNTWKRAALTTW